MRSRRAARARRPGQAPPEAGAGRRRLALSVGLILVAGALTYANSVAGPFIFDDLAAVSRNETIRHLSDLAAVLSPPRETPVAARPIPNLSLAINYAIGGLDVSGYHLWNISVHLAAALVLFGIVRRTLLAPRIGGEARRSANGVALASALLWTVHPIQSEAVDYVSQRTESMMGLFLFLTLYCAIRARRSSGAWRWQGASVVACAFGMGCKESMVTAPILVILYDRVFEFDSFAEALRSRWRLYGGLAATWAGLGALMWNTPRSSVGASSGAGIWIYLLNQLEMVVVYLRLAVWPVALVADYGAPRTLGFHDVMPQALVVAALLAASIVALVRWPKVGFLGAALFLTLAPTTSVIPIATEVGAERRLYVPLAALAVLVVLAGRWIVDRMSARFGAGWPPLAGRVAIVVVLAALATRTVYRNHDYAVPLTLWQTSVERRPQGRARSLLASELIEAGRHDEGMAQLQEAVRDYRPAHFAIATELYGAGRFEDAIVELKQLKTPVPEPRTMVAAEELEGLALEALADSLFAERRFGEAIPQYRLLLAAHPGLHAWEHLAAALANTGHLEEAVDAFGRAATLDPDSPGTQRNLEHARTLLADARVRSRNEKTRR